MQEYWSGLPFPPPGYLPHPEIKLMPITSPALAGKFFTTILQYLKLIFKLIFKKSCGKTNPCKNSQKYIKKERQGGSLAQL